MYHLALLSSEPNNPLSEFHFHFKTIFGKFTNFLCLLLANLINLMKSACHNCNSQEKEEHAIKLKK